MLKKIGLLWAVCGLFLWGVALAGPHATLNWSTPTTNTDGTPILVALTYNLYQGASATTLIRVATDIPVTTYTISTGLVAKRTYCWAVTAVEDGQEGGRSAVVCDTWIIRAPILTVT